MLQNGHVIILTKTKFIKNKSPKDSIKTPLKLDTGLGHFEINQMANSRAF